MTVAESELTSPEPVTQSVVEQPASEMLVTSFDSVALSVTPSPSSKLSQSMKRPPFDGCVGWKIQVVEEHNPDENLETEEALIGVVVATIDVVKQILVCFDLSLGSGDLVDEANLESIPYSSADIKWLEGNIPIPIVKRKTLTKSTSRDSKSSSGTRLEALPAGTSALSMANELKKKVANIDENIFIQSLQLAVACPELIVDSEAEVQVFQKQLVKPSIDNCGGYLVRILEDSNDTLTGATDSGDILTDNTDMFGIVISNVGKKMIQVHFFSETTTIVHKSTAGGIAEQGSPITGVDLVVIEPDAETEEELVEILPYSSKGIVWYKNVTA